MQPYAGNRQSSVTLPLRPVIVFITGQDFQGSQNIFQTVLLIITIYVSEGAGNLGGARLMREELVVVTVEYRSLSKCLRVITTVKFHNPSIQDLSALIQ